MAKQTDNNPRSDKSKRKSPTFWFCVLFFVSAWMFVLGILVGRGTAPVHFDMESLQKELAALKEAVQQKEQQWYKSRSGTVSDKPDLEFHEALKKNTMDARAGLERHRPEESAEKIKRLPVPERKKPPESKPEPAKSADERKDALGAADTEGVFTIQVAALREAKSADAKVAELGRKGYPAYRSVGIIAGQGTWYRVRIGSFKDRTSASRMLEQLKKENIKGFVVNK